MAGHQTLVVEMDRMVLPCHVCAAQFSAVFDTFLQTSLGMTCLTFPFGQVGAIGHPMTLMDADLTATISQSGLNAQAHLWLGAFEM